MSDRKFRIVIPAHLEKSDDGSWRIYGLASTNQRDLQGEIVDPKGLDLTPIKKGKGLFNFDHQKGPENIVGVIDKYKKDSKGLYLGGYLFKGHERAKAIYSIMGSLTKSDRGRVGMSIEGVVKGREGKDKKIVAKALITGCAITFNPINTDAYCDLVKSFGEVSFAYDMNLQFNIAPTLDDVVSELAKAIGMEEDFFKGRGKDKQTRKQRRSAAFSKLETNINKPKKNAEAVYSAKYDALTREAEKLPRVESIKKLEEASKLKQEYYKKALTVGSEYATTLPQNLSGGAALAQEDLDRKKKKKRKPSKSLKKADAVFYKSAFFEIISYLRMLYPKASTTQIFETVKERLNTRFPDLNI